MARIGDDAGEGARIFVKLNPEAGLAQADASDRLRPFGGATSPVAGLPVAIKDLFDIVGEATLGGSRVLATATPAVADAPGVARLRSAGAILIGRTNMTEFAYSGLGVNPHYGTPGNPHDRTRIPGGSSSGAAVAVADCMATAALGTDTGGSVRIPAAFCGITGFKPSQYRVPLEGCLPVSSSLDSIGPLAPSVACCAILDAVLAAEPVRPPAQAELADLRFAVPTNYVLNDMDASVADAFQGALTRLSEAGARVREIEIPELDELPEMLAAGGFCCRRSLRLASSAACRAGRGL